MMIGVVEIFAIALYSTLVEAVATSSGSSAGSRDTVAWPTLYNSGLYN